MIPEAQAALDAVVAWRGSAPAESVACNPDTDPLARDMIAKIDVYKATRDPVTDLIELSMALSHLLPPEEAAWLRYAAVFAQGAAR